MPWVAPPLYARIWLARHGYDNPGSRSPAWNLRGSYEERA